MTYEEKQTGGFKSGGEFFAAVRKACDGERWDNRLDVLQKATLAEGTDSAGGFLVPSQWAKPIYAASLEASIVRPRAQILPMTSDTGYVTVALDSNRGTNIYGGVVLTWVAEGADQIANAAGPTIARVGLTVHEAVASTWVSNQLEDDTENFSGFITKTFGDAIGFLLDDLFIWGTGSGQPFGIMNAPALISIARNAGFGTVLADDFANMAARFLPGSLGKGVYLMNQTVLQTLANDATTGANANAFLDLSSLTCLGMPIIVTEKCAASASLGDVILADFSQYVIGEREMIVSASRHATYSSNTYGWFQNQTLWKVTLRVDGQPLLASAITPRRGGSTLSSYVALTVAS